MIRDVLISELKKRFPARSFQEGTPPESIAVFPAAHTDVGDVVILGDENEIIIEVGSISHEHFDCYDSTLSEAQREDLIIQDVIDFLEELFSDRVLLWTSESGAGGWRRIKDRTDIKRISEWKGFKELLDSGVIQDDGRYFFWSGPVENIG
jgi:hypothetical protein